MTVAAEDEVEEPADVTRCTFCLKPTDEVETMVAGPGVYICNECVALSVELINNKPTDKSKMANWRDRLSDDDLLEALPKFHAVETQVERQLASWVRQARSRGITWTRIGAALGMTRQSAWERFSGEE
jgi:ATP-dependent Clp protease ATP-binding subunit ClpX